MIDTLQKDDFYKIIDHTADLGIWVSGSDIKELFENAGKGIFDLIAGLENISPENKSIIEVEGKDREELIVNFLNHLIFEFEVHLRVYRDFDIIDLRNESLIAEGKWEKFNNKKHPIRYAIKAVTYHNLRIWKKRNKFYLSLIFDI